MMPEPRSWPLARPDLDGFRIEGRRPTPCLLLHGFTAAPTELKPLAHALAAAGFTVEVPRLPGHGTAVEELAQTGPDALIGAAAAALARLGPRTLIAGQSMGALLALLVAAEAPERVAGLATLAAPFWFADRRARALTPLLRFTPLGRLVRNLPKAPTAIPPERRPLHFTYDRFPVPGILALADLMRRARRALPKVTSPLLVVHGALDRTAPPAGAPILVREAASARKELALFGNSRHVLTYDLESDAVCARVVSFFDSLDAAA